MQLGAEGASRLSEEQRVEIISRARSVVNKVQLKALHNVISLLEEDIFVDRQKTYFLIIDRLDEGWADEKIRFKLIRSLIESIKTFRKINNIKIIIALRTDLLQSVIIETKDAGFQEEKYESLYLKLGWSANEIERMLDQRVRYMFEKQYTRQQVSLEDIMPKNQVEKGSAIDYILHRTLLRPRDAIIFLNECIERAEGAVRIKMQVIRDAEGTYSEKRLRSLFDEWCHYYPSLPKCVGLLKRRSSVFKLDDITDHEFERIAYEILSDETVKQDKLYRSGEKCFLEDELPREGFNAEAVALLYQVGIVGIKFEPFQGVRWSYIDEPYANTELLRGDTVLSVHKAFWAALGIVRDRGSDRVVEIR